MSNYQYPIDTDWTHKEIADIINFLNLIEQAYESSADTKVFESAYNKYRTIVNSISAQKQLDKKFQQESGYSIYQVIKWWKENPDAKKIQIK